MGPRPLGRGDYCRACHAISCRRSFNGAATSRPRRRVGQVLGLVGGPRASMGPRPLGRGDCDGDRGRGRGRVASMGPRPLGRGDAIGGYHVTGAVQASMGPRPLGRGDSHGGCPWSGTKTASMGPRPLGRGDSPIVNSQLGQSLLQWGRDLSAAETRCRPRSRMMVLLLQWGRDLSAAETRACKTCCACVRGACFNGAATSRPRRPLVPADEIAGAGVASMGPRPLGRGDVVDGSQSHVLPVASMGPRPLGRGDTQAAENHRRTAELQWGRDLSAAETQLSRKFLIDVLPASMGPRPLGRGDELAFTVVNSRS